MQLLRLLPLLDSMIFSTSVICALSSQTRPQVWVINFGGLAFDIISGHVISAFVLPLSGIEACGVAHHSSAQHSYGPFWCGRMQER